MRHLVASLLTVVVLCGATHVTAEPRPLGDVRVLAKIPPPGFPESVVVRGNRAFVSTQSRSGTAGLGASTVVMFNARTGKLLRTYTIQGENLAQDHSLTNMAFDAQYRLYVISSQLGLLRLDLKTGAQTVYAPPVPNLPTCASVSIGTPCSPTVADQAPLPNSLVFDPAGYAYITDSMQATIFRVPPGGGTPAIWFQDPRFDGIVGANGIRVSPDGQKIYVAVTVTSLATGPIYTLPLIDAPQAADLTLFHQFGLEGPDEITFGRSGKLYVSLAVSNAAAVLGPNGAEVARYSGPANDGTVIDSPSGVAFRGGSLLMNNHALFTQNASHMVLFDIFVGDHGVKLFRPRLP